MSLAPGETLSHYKILRRLGSGGMGVVYEAEDTRLGRHVALKLLSSALREDAQALARFQAEARAASSLNHPHICTVHDVGRHEGHPFIVMELLEGQTLRHLMGRRPMDVEKILDLGAQIADALDAASARNIVHRDVKPANVFVTKRGQAKVLDFGLARRAIDPGAEASQPTFPEHQTAAGTTMGTVVYMSPEQARGQELDGRSDLFALGAVLYEMATGQLPFDGKSAAEVFDAILNREPVPAGRLNPKVPVGLESIIAKALRKERGERYQTAGEIRADLQRLLRETSAAHPPGFRTFVATLSAEGVRRGLRTTGGAAVILLVLAAGVWLWPRARTPEPPPSPAGGVPSIAVLPFVNIGQDASSEYFSDGLTEELLNVLAKNPGLKVAARTSAFQFKGRNEDLRGIGRKLNVATVLEGSVRKAGNRVRITAQLVSVANGFHLWSEAYDRELTDIFAVQDDIARSVAGALQVTLRAKNESSTRTGGSTVEAYSAYLQGRYFSDHRTQESLEKAVTYYRQALTLDPGYAPAWTGLAEAKTRQAGAGYVSFTDGYEGARRDAEKALALDPNLAEAHAALGWIRTSYKWDWAGADAAYKRALELAPGNAAVVSGAGRLAATMGRLDEALDLDRRAAELDPLSVRAHYYLGLHALYARRWEEAEAALRKVLELNPEYPNGHQQLGQVHLARSQPEAALREMEREREPLWRRYGLALVYHALGRKKETDAALAELLEKDKEDAAFQIAQVYAFRGEADQAFAWLERAYAQRDPGFSNFKSDPLLEKLAGDARYEAFLEKMRLPLRGGSDPR